MRHGRDTAASFFCSQNAKPAGSPAGCKGLEINSDHPLIVTTFDAMLARSTALPAGHVTLFATDYNARPLLIHGGTQGGPTPQRPERRRA
jgi:hypothetical protein